MVPKKTKILIIVLIVAILLLLVIQFFARQRPPTTNSSQTDITQPNIIQPINDTETSTTTVLVRIVSTSLPANSIPVATPIEITFDKPVLPATLDIQITPRVDYLASYDPTYTKLILEPKETWGFARNYTLDISTNTNQVLQKLDKKYQYNISTLEYSGI